MPPLKTKYKETDNSVRVIFPDKGFIESQSVESFLLFSILNKLEEIRCGLIDVEEAIKK